MNKQLFRKTSLDQLQSPEQLDRLLTVTSLKGWIALVGTAVLITAIIIWSFIGSLSVNVYGQGILISSGGIQNIVSNENGQITDIRVEAGDEIEKGEAIARLKQPELLNEIRSVELQLDNLTATEKTQNQVQLEDLNERLENLRNQLNIATRVVSPFSGNVVEVKTKRGEFINRGMSVISMERTEGQLNALEAVFYVSLNDGKKIQPGMEVKIEPTSILKENYGYLLGRVTSVADFPSTFQGMMDMIGNEELVKTLSGSGAPVQVTVSLIPDQNTVSGYKWTSSDGPPVSVQSGTLSNGMITVEDAPPIAKIFPQFK